MHVCRAVLPQMIENRAGKIILLVGPGTEGPRPNFSAYAAVNAALVRFAETLAEEVREANIQVNCMNPGPTYTSMTDEILSAGDRAGAREVSMAHEIRSNGGTPPERQISLAQFLISTRSNHLSGKLIGVNDDWRRLEQSNDTPELYTLRRVSRS
jgi:3-oxoacyl-[acyl-carrier protein] reductase